MVKGKRSPKYPFITLERAIERAEEYYNKEGRNKANIATALKHWGYGAKSSGGIQTVAALKNYGLIEDEGSGARRLIKLSELALKILLDTRTDSSDREEAIKKAALNPKIFSDLWALWRIDGLPSNENIKHFLIFEKDFNENTVEDFIKKFRETIEFSNLTSSDSLHKMESDIDGENDMDTEPVTLDIKSSKHRQTSKSVYQNEIANIRVARDCAIRLIADGPYDKKNIEALVAQLKLGLELGTYDDPEPDVQEP